MRLPLCYRCMTLKLHFSIVIFCSTGNFCCIVRVALHVLLLFLSFSHLHFSSYTQQQDGPCMILALPQSFMILSGHRHLTPLVGWGVYLPVMIATDVM